MTSPRDALEAVARAIANSNELPREMSVLLQEADLSFEDADVDLPLLEIQLLSSNDVILNNTDFIGFVTDDNGNHVGRVYGSDYELELEMTLWTVKDSGYDPDTLGRKLRDALYPYSSYGPQNSLPDEEGQPIEDITYINLGDGQRDDDLLQNPTTRRWTQTMELWGCEQFSTNEDYIVTVDAPADGEFSDTNGDGLIDNSSPDTNV